MKIITKVKEISLKQILVGVHFAFSALFFIFIFLVLLFHSLGYNILVHEFCYYFLFPDLSVLTLFSILGLIWLMFPWVAPGLSGFWQIYFVDIFMGFFYAFLAYGLLREKKAASAVALISSLLTIFADIYFIFRTLLLSQDVTFLGFIASAIAFNLVLVLLLLSYIFRKFQKLKPILLGLLVSTIIINVTFTFIYYIIGV